MSELPTGTVTFLLTDIEGSTRLWDEHHEAMREALARHDALLAEKVEAAGGVLLKQRGEGDSAFSVFERASDAVAAACELQRTLGAEEWPSGIPLRLRMALHTGEAEEREGDYFGPTVNRCARLRSVAHGGQIVVSEATSDVVRDGLPPDVTLEDLGLHGLPDLSRPEHIFQLLHPSLPAEFPPLRTLDARPNNLPVQLSALIGREADVQEAKALLSREEVRLLTLTGPGGIGKTRLGLQLAAELSTDFEHGVWYVPLATVTDPDLVDSAIAQALNVSEATGQPLAETLKEELSGRELLLVLDNFEQVIGAASLVGELLRGCRGVKVIVTSRESLRLSGAQDCPVRPLGLPDPRRLPSADTLRGFAAPDLFVQRARAVRPDFEVSEENAGAIAEICLRLDGLPLAIELAAARVKLFPPQALLSRLTSRLKLLTAGALDLPERHKTLRDTIAWSYDLLKEDEQTLMRRMSAFNGGCTIDAAEAVCGEGIDVFEGISSLVDKSLLRQTEQPDGEPRFVMFETIREFGAELLGGSGEEGDIRQRHGVWFVELAELAGKELRGAQQAMWLERLEQDHANFIAALEWSLGADAGAGLGLAVALSRFWLTRGHLREGRHWMETALGSAGDAGAEHRPRGLLQAGTFALYQGDPERAAQAYQEALVLARKLDNRPLIATALGNLGIVAMDQGRYGEARALYEESAEMARALGDDQGVATALNNIGNIAYNQSDYHRAAQSYDESLAIARKLGNKRMIADTLGNLGVVADERGDTASARSLHEESLSMRRELGDQQGIARALRNIGNAALRQSDYAGATALVEESLAIARDLGDKQTIVLSLASLGEIAHVQGDLPKARRIFEDGLEIARQLGDRQAIATALNNIGSLARAEGNHDEARSLSEESLTISRELQDRQGEAEALICLAEIERELGDLDEACAFATRALELQRSLGSKRGLGSASLTLGGVLRAQGDDDGARARLEEGLGAAQQVGDRRSVAEILESLAGVAVVQGLNERGARLLGAADGLRRTIQAPLPPGGLKAYESIVATVRDRLPPELFESVWGEGREMTADEAVSAALQWSIDEVVQSPRPDLESINRLAGVAELRDDITGMHIERMSHYAAVLARGNGLEPEDCDKILQAARLHDIGKIGIPDGVLKKPGGLTDDEWVVMRSHPAEGAKQLKGSTSRIMQMAEAIALTHHERWDGTGYPKGLRGEEIPLWGRISSIVDVFDALTTERPYKKAWPTEEALAEIEKCAGTHFDPDLVVVFKRVFPDILEVKRRFADPAPAEKEAV